MKKSNQSLHVNSHEFALEQFKQELNDILHKYSRHLMSQNIQRGIKNRKERAHV